MKKWKLGILGASNIAYHRFLPALQKSKQISFAGIASRDPNHCIPFIERFGGQCYPDYKSLLEDSEIDCVYVPLPPALHAVWGLQVLESGKHLFMEKPFTTSLEDTKRLLKIAESQNLVVHENYMFLYHRQLTAIKKMISDKRFGKIKIIRTAFTFPFRGEDDFRYHPDLGGGALFDCGGYPLLLASELLGNSVRLCWSGLYQDSQYGVDMAGSAILQNDIGLTAHIFFGMDDTYRCELEIWGSKASIMAPRIFTAPPNFTPILQLKIGNEEHFIKIEEDDQFLNSIDFFIELIEKPVLRLNCAKRILRQSELIEMIRKEIY